MNRPGSHPQRATQEAAHWYALQRQGGLSAMQQARFMDWLVASPEHLREYLAVGRVAGELGDAMRAMPIDLEALIAGKEPAQAVPDNVVALPARRSSSPPAAARPRRRRLPRAVAAAAVLVCLGIAAHVAWPQSRHYVAAHGAPRSFELPDRTVVHLNAESELSMRFGLFQRRVELARGQASFVVAADRRPFTVQAAGLQVQDIGTTFDVSLRREQARIDVAEGRVRVVGDAGAGRLLADLRAGQSARIDYRDHAVSVSHEDVGMMTAWWERRVVFRDEPLRDVADQFNRLSAVRLHVEDPAAGALRLTGNLSGDDLESLRAFLDEQPALRTVVTANEIRVQSHAR
ncbi:FecR family protein [Pseudoxanthomonas putridarboris]|uniref:FecR domain-containing protein n=1 Tax=Pseudoxanthomonas putridarboris TaxID=752605 RepID=A0ABU9J0T9_9GAMM